MHHREHPDVIGFEDVNDRVGERATEVSPGLRRTIDTKERGLGLDLGDEFVDVVVAQPGTGKEGEDAR